MLFAAWILAVCAASRPADEFHERCAALSSPEAIERAAAERWLAAHLEPARYAEVVELARGADAEVRARLVRILAADPRHLELALALAVEPAHELAELGLSAVRAAVAVLDPKLGEPARRGHELGTTLERLAGSAWPRQLVLAPGRPLGELALELEFTGVLEIGVTLDPALAARVPKNPTELIVGPWEDALDQLLGAYEVGVEGHGLPEARVADTETSGFLRITVESERPKGGVEHVGAWLLALARTGDEAARVQAARNLAATGLAPVLVWLGRRAAAGDAAALEGVLLAGARGRLAPVLLDPALVARVFAQAERGGRSSALALATLAQLPATDELRARLAEGLAGSPARQWSALNVLERAGFADEAGLTTARALLADARAPAVLRLQALYTCARLAPVGAAAPSVAGALELLLLPQHADDRARLARTLAALGVTPPARDPAELAAAGPGFALAPRLNLIEAWLWNGDAAALGAQLADWTVAAGAEEPRFATLLADVLAPWPARGGADLLRRALAEGRRRTPAAARALERLELLLRLVPAEEVAAQLARGGWLLTGPSADLALLGALAGYPRAIAAEEPAREALHGALAAALANGSTRLENSELLAALERAASGMYAAGRDETGDAFTKRVRTALRKVPKGPLRKRVDLELWPAAPLMPSRDIQREFDARALPAGL
jgi:hypothetical protein